MRERYRSRAGSYRPEPWRDVLAAYLVHRGLQLATHDQRVRMLHALSDEWRHMVGEAMCARDRDNRPAR